MNDSPSISSLKTEISEFCQAFTCALKPFATSLEAVRTEIQGQGEADATLQRLIAEFSDGNHRLDSLISKVEQQQAYLIIFGPLKSGKSTLMNAISAAYVSEVTSLPAYPCLVHVKHGDENSFVAWRYNGEKLKFPDNASLQAVIKKSHATLAERLREAEEAGETFDPGVHYPEAIRRVDVSLPARNLKDSLTVLVDTPGLYTRMKFGYNLMTREFRNSAACAVFVVKTDNLFLEQVFEEFTELLDLFSRIFIVVNIDGSKRDLDPDGSLQPSLESRSPGEVIGAFQSLVMSAPLRRAQEEGRLKIYPVDLLNSASAAMKQASSSEPAVTMADANKPATPATAAEATPATSGAPPLPPQDGDSPEAPPPAIVSDANDSGDAAEVEIISPLPPAEEFRTSVMPAAWSEHPETSFSLFLKDLTEYLNSSEYLQEFMGDALLMGTNIGTEVRDRSAPESAAALKTSRQALTVELADAKARLAAMENLAELDINKSFAQLRSTLQKHIGELSAAAAAEARKKATQQLEEWYTTDQSVAELQQAWARLLADSGRETGSQSHLKARALVSTPLGGISLDESLRGPVLGVTELLGAVALVARTTVAEKAPALLTNDFLIKPEHLKVRKSWWDWLTFSSLAAVRRKIFGTPDAMERAVPAPIKEKRLGAEGKQALEECILTAISSQLPSELQRASEALMTRYVEMYGKELRASLATNSNNTTARIATLLKRIESNQAVCGTLDNLIREADKMLAKIDSLSSKYQSHSRVTGTALEMADDDDDETKTTSAPDSCGDDHPHAAGDADPDAGGDDDPDGGGDGDPDGAEIRDDTPLPSARPVVWPPAPSPTFAPQTIS